MIDALQTAWPLIVLLACIVGAVLAIPATREMRKKMAEAQGETIAVYQQTIKAKDELAVTLTEATAKQITILTEERKDSDSRHEAVIKDYRDKLHEVRNSLQACSDSRADAMAQIAEYKARTDFKPVMEFLREENRKSTQVQQQIMQVLSVIAPVLERVMASLQMPSSTPRLVEVVNSAEHPVPVKPTETP